MSEKFYRSTYLNVNLDAILNNYQTFNQLHHNKTVISVIKANSYGLGSTSPNGTWGFVFRSCNT